MAYIVKRKVRTYYKYVDGSPVDTNTPIFASQTEATNGKDGVKFLTAQNYFTITGTNTVAVNNNAVVTIDVGAKTQGIKSVVYNGIVVASAYPAMVLKTVQCSPDNSQWTTITDSFGGRNTTVNTPLNIPYPNNYRYLRFTTGNDDGRHGNGGVNNFRIKYVKIPSTPVESTESDYDYYVDEVKSYLASRKKRRYYKYVYEYKNWTRPNLTSDGIMGGSTAACQANSATAPAYYAFDGNMGNYWRSGTNPSWITFYSPVPLKVSSFQWKGFYTVAKSGTLYGSDNNSSWTTIKTFTNSALDFTITVPETTKAYKYYRIEVAMTGDVTHAYDIGITAKEEVKKSVEVSSTDSYDYYVDEVKSYAAKRKKRVYYKNSVVVDKNQSGTYSFTPTKDCLADITLVGGGAGGAFNSSSNRSSAAAGGSGSGCTFRCKLKGGVAYTVNVGGGGVVNGGLDATATGGRGGNSTLQVGGTVLATAEGGIGGNVWWPNGSSQGAPAPLPTVSGKTSNFEFMEWYLQKQGVPGGIGGNPSPGGASVISGTSYGQGGQAWNAGGGSHGEVGKIGYGKVIVKYESTADDYDDYIDTVY